MERQVERTAQKTEKPCHSTVPHELQQITVLGKRIISVKAAVLLHPWWNLYITKINTSFFITLFLCMCNSISSFLIMKLTKQINKSQYIHMSQNVWKMISVKNHATELLYQWKIMPLKDDINEKSCHWKISVKNHAT